MVSGLASSIRSATESTNFDLAGHDVSKLIVDDLYICFAFITHIIRYYVMYYAKPYKLCVCCFANCIRYIYACDIAIISIVSLRYDAHLNL